MKEKWDKLKILFIVSGSLIIVKMSTPAIKMESHSQKDNSEEEPSSWNKKIQKSKNM